MQIANTRELLVREVGISRDEHLLLEPLPGSASAEGADEAFPGDPLLLVAESDDEIDECAEYELV